MNKCLKITLAVAPSEHLLHNIIQKGARELDLEGLVQIVDVSTIKIVVCGKKETVDLFVDYLHRQAIREKIEEIEIEPFLKDRDYRGVFRVIE